MKRHINFEEEAPTTETVEALKDLVAQIATRYRIGKGRIIGHRDVRKLSADGTDTVCPDENLYSLLEARRGHLGLYKAPHTLDRPGLWPHLHNMIVTGTCSG